MKYLFFALRPKQWIKNLFIFLPLIFGKKLFDYPINLKVLAAFGIFCLASGAVYLVNDILDVKKDRVHPLKRLRPVASGKLGIAQAVFAAAILGVLSITLSFVLDANFGMITVIYLTFNFIYTKVLKDVVIIDVFCLSGFFLLRVMAGSVTAKVGLSHWIIIMTGLLALFLGFNKRRQELRLLSADAARHRFVLTKYNGYFIDQMVAIVTSSIAVVYMLYTVDVRTVREFGNTHLMYSIIFVYYGIFRYLYLMHKLKKEGDPTRIIFFDKVFQLNFILWVISCILVIYFGG